MKLELIDEKVAADHSLQEQQQTFIESENWPPNSSDLNPVDYSVWGRGIATDGVMSHTFKHWPAEMRGNWLLGSAKPATDQMPKRLMMVIKAKGAHVEFRLD